MISRWMSVEVLGAVQKVKPIADELAEGHGRDDRQDHHGQRHPRILRPVHAGDDGPD
jgi:hypothetical protein